MLGRLVMIGFIAIFLFRELWSLRGLTTPALVTVVAGIVVVTVTWGWFWWWLAAGPEGVAQAVAVVASTAAVIVMVRVNHLGVFPFYYAVIVAGTAFRWTIGVVLVPVVTVLTVALWWPGGQGNAYALQVLIVTGLFGGAAITVRRYIAAQVELDVTRDEVRRLAAVEARMELARDLHDRLGQQLTATIMQGELLAMDLATDVVDAARERSATVLAGSREALNIMREMVTEVREPGLEAEVAVAERLLDASGISCRASLPPAGLPAGAGRVLGWVVREGVTNVMRHSGASSCTISVTSGDGIHTLTISDDGRGPGGGNGGNGLRHMRERVSAEGGTIDLSEDRQGGCTLTATIPGPT